MISIIIVNLRVVTAVADVDGKLSIDCAEDSVTSVPLFINSHNRGDLNQDWN